LDKKVLDWLLAGPAWLKYAVELQLLDLKPDVSPLLRDSAIRKLIDRLKGNSAGIPAIKSGKVHYTESGKSYWDLFFLADVGLSIKDLGLEAEAEEIFHFQSREGTFTIPPNVQDNYFCMSAILVASLARMGYRDDPRVIKYARSAMSAQMPGGGWDCYGDSYGGSGDSCPMDDMNILMLLGQYLQYRENPQLDGAIEHLMAHWEIGNNRYGFGVGKRFRSLQYPAVKYGILRVLDALSFFPYAVKSPAYQSMLDFVRAKVVNGLFFAESTDAAFADFDFSQTKEPSRWITFLVNRIEKRIAQE
jgi:hypothetical protein